MLETGIVHLTRLQIIALCKYVFFVVVVVVCFYKLKVCDNPVVLSKSIDAIFQ